MLVTLRGLRVKYSMSKTDHPFQSAYLFVDNLGEFLSLNLLSMTYLLTMTI